MKIGILTFTENTNIGQRLQNYALQYILEDMGNDVETIKQSYPFNEYKKALRELLKLIIRPRCTMKEIKRKEKFDKFNRNYIHFYSKVLPFYGDNSWISSKFNAFIVGSDQVWSPISPDVGANYFLTFAKREQRMTYAPSLSVDRMPDQKVEVYRQYLNGFNNISVREDKGADIIEELIGKRPAVVLDPTLLLEKDIWDSIKEPYKKMPLTPFVLAMFLGESQSEELRAIAQKLNLIVYEINSMSEISPSEFLALIEGATIVATDSYHVTIFSIIYNIPFINFQRIGASVMNSRFKTLYRILGINQREWNYLKNHTEDITSMDFEKIKVEKDKAKKYSYEFLENQLKTIG